MAFRVRLAKDATTGAQASLKIRAAKPPFYIECRGGAADIQHSMDSPSVADSAATWRTLGSLSGAVTPDAMVVSHPLYRIRANVTSGTATVDLLEYRTATT